MKNQSHTRETLYTGLLTHIASTSAEGGYQEHKGTIPVGPALPAARPCDDECKVAENA